MPNFDWSVVNTALLLAALGYLWRQSVSVNAVRQVLLGMEGHGGIVGEVKMLRERSHDLANRLTILSGDVQHLTQVMEERQQRRP